MPSFLRFLYLFQGSYYFLTGLWPLFHIGSFQGVTGPKTDLWLVKMVALLTALIGFLILRSGVRKEGRTEIFLLAVISAACYCGIDLYYGMRAVISPVYLADGVLQTV